ncbi:DUF4178 domain-containing protein [Carbonactinospora thermoautotrophica]|uniref:DUF4178 domain-containing protein n=1 Tax=Carbonactinospora thermoautotrophica TaxID=1469144 RepID=UPI0022701A2A|nr:DUF4178 domain-containing protein [Carbonactinospora thermoautotrophica]
MLSGVTGALVVLLLLALIVLVVILIRQSRKTAQQAPAAPQPADPFADAYQIAGDPRALKPGDMVEYLGQRFFVRGTLRLREGGYRWSEHFLDDAEGTKRWISVEEDPDLQVVMWTELQDSGLLPTEKVVTLEGVEYRRVEHGTAQFQSQGTTGLGNAGRVEYVDYEAPGGKFLAFERFEGGRWEAGVGDLVPQGALTIYPSS